MIKILSISTLLTSILLLVLVFFILLRRRRTKLNVIFAFMCLNVTLWLFCYSQAYRISNSLQSLFWFKVGYLGLVFLPVSFLQFVCSFLNVKKYQWYSRVSIFVGIFTAVIILGTPYLIKSTKSFSWGLYPQAGIWHPCFLLFFFGLVSTGISLLFFAYIKKKAVDSNVRVQQIKYILLAFIIFTFASVDFIPNYGINVFPFGFIPTSLFLLIICYSIVRYRLMDVTLAVTRTSIFVSVYALVLGLPFLLVYGWRNNLYYYFGENWWLVPLVTSTVLATAGPFIYLYIQKKAEDRLFQEQKTIPIDITAGLRRNGKNQRPCPACKFDSSYR